MKRRYNTLNEEMNRIKSLFGESRLYGNLVDKQEVKQISEQYKLFSGLKNAFGNVKLKTFDNLGIMAKQLNVKINSIDDLINNIKLNKSFWQDVVDINWDKIIKNLEGLEILINRGDLADKVKYSKKIVEDNILIGFPELGGIKSIIKDMISVEQGGKMLSTVDDGIRVVDKKTGDIIIIEKPKGSKVKTEPEEAEIVTITKTEEAVIDYKVVPKGTTLDDLNNKSVLGTKENMERLEEAAYKKGYEEASKGNQTVYNINVGDNANVNMASGTINSKPIGEVAKDVVENTDPPKDIPAEEIGNWRKKLLKITTNGLKKLGGGTRYWWNFHTFNLPFLPKFETFKTNKEQIGQFIFRTIVLLPVTYESIRIATSDDKYFAKDWENNFLTAAFDDITRKAANIDYEGPMKMYNKMFSDLTTNLSKGKVNTTVLKNDIEQAVENEIIYAGTTTVDKDGKRLSTLTCTKLLNFNSDAEVLEHVLNKHKGNAISKSLKILMSTYGEATEKFISAEGNLKEYVDLLLNVIKVDADTLEIVKLQRLNCKDSKKTNEEIEFRSSDEYKCTIWPDSTGGAR